MFNNYKNTIKIFLVLGLAFFISSFSIKSIFLANSPKIRPNLTGYFLAKINTTKANILAKFNFNFSLFNTSTETKENKIAKDKTMEYLKNSLKPVTKGIEAASVPGYSYTVIKLNEIEWAEITYTLKNGKTVVIRYPKGTEPPPPSLYER